LANHSIIDSPSCVVRAFQELPSSVGKLKLLSILNVDRNRMAILPCEVRQ